MFWTEGEPWSASKRCSAPLQIEQEETPSSNYNVSQTKQDTSRKFSIRKKTPLALTGERERGCISLALAIGSFKRGCVGLSFDCGGHPVASAVTWMWFSTVSENILDAASQETAAISQKYSQCLYIGNLLFYIHAKILKSRIRVKSVEKLHGCLEITNHPISKFLNMCFDGILVSWGK